MTLKDKIKAFSALGAFLRDFNATEPAGENSYSGKLNRAIRESYHHNPWFTPTQIQAALYETGQLLKEEMLEQWLTEYKGLEQSPAFAPKTVGIVMAGNIPAVGFHDLLCTIMSGNRALVKLSSNDRFLIPCMIDFLTGVDAGFAQLVQFTDRTLSGYDAVIATGSNNTSRYFEYYFSGVPHIIRKNRNSVAVLNGREGAESLSLLCKDIFSYFGLGCRSVSHLLVPEGYSFDNLFNASESWVELATHHKYASNYMYYKTIYLMNNQPFFDNGIIILKKENAYSSPVSVVYYTEYSHLDEVRNQLSADREQLQCILSEIDGISGVQKFGTSQKPRLNDYADGVDTLSFLLELSNFGR